MSIDLSLIQNFDFTNWQDLLFLVVCFVLIVIIFSILFIILMQIGRMIRRLYRKLYGKRDDIKKNRVVAADDSKEDQKNSEKNKGGNKKSSENEENIIESQKEELVNTIQKESEKTASDDSSAKEKSESEMSSQSIKYIQNQEEVNDKKLKIVIPEKDPERIIEEQEKEKLSAKEAAEVAAKNIIGAVAMGAGNLDKKQTLGQKIVNSLDVDSVVVPPNMSEKNTAGGVLPKTNYVDRRQELQKGQTSEQKNTTGNVAGVASAGTNKGQIVAQKDVNSFNGAPIATSSTASKKNVAGNVAGNTAGASKSQDSINHLLAQGASIAQKNKLAQIKAAASSPNINGKNDQGKSSDSSILFSKESEVPRTKLEYELRTDPKIWKAERAAGLTLSPVQRAKLVKQIFSPVLGRNISKTDLKASVKKMNQKLTGIKNPTEHAKIRKEIKFFKKIGGIK